MYIFTLTCGNVPTWRTDLADWIALLLLNVCVFHFILIVLLYRFLTFAARWLEVERGVFTFWLVVSGIIHIISISHLFL